MIARIVELRAGRYRLPAPERLARPLAQGVPLGVIFGNRATYRPAALRELSKADLALILRADLGEVRYRPSVATGTISWSRAHMVARILEHLGIVELPEAEQLTLC
jgi:hypothetical protein